MINFKLHEALVRPCGGAVRDSVTGGGPIVSAERAAGESLQARPVGPDLRVQGPVPSRSGADPLAPKPQTRVCFSKLKQALN